MSNASSKRSVMTLFSNKNDIYCHQVKIVLAEKGVAYENEEVDLQALSEKAGFPAFLLFSQDRNKRVIVCLRLSLPQKH